MNQRMFTLGNVKFKVISLNKPLTEDIEVYPGDPKPNYKIFSKLEEKGHEYYIQIVGDHIFQPHGDAPKHQNLDKKEYGFDKFDMSYEFNEGCLIDLSSIEEAKNIDGIKFLVEIKKKHLLPHLSKIKNKGAIIIRTGYDKWLELNYPHDPKYIPYLTEEAGKLLAQLKNILVIGIDSLSVDPTRDKPIHTVHQLLKNKLIVEGLVNLYSIPKEKSDRFSLQTSLLRIANATGGPILAYAYIQQE